MLPLEIPTSSSCPGLRFLGSQPFYHPDLGVQHIGSASVVRVQEAGGTRMGISREQPRSRDSASCYPLRHQPITQPALGFSPLSGFCCWVVFGSIWEWDGRAPHAGLGTCSSPRPTASPPFLQHMCTTCKVSPLSRDKESPPSVKMVGVRKGQEHPSL